jgi:hypothetical protein
VLDALDSEALEERVEPGDGEGDPARARPARARLDEEPGVLVDLPEDLVPTRVSGGRPKNRVYQSMLASRSDTGTPAKRSVIAPGLGLVQGSRVGPDCPGARSPWNPRARVSVEGPGGTRSAPRRKTEFATRVVRVRQPTLSRSLDRAERTDSIALSRLAKISSRTTLPLRSSKTCAPSWWISTPLPLPRPW